MATERYAFKVQQVIGEACNPYERTMERLHALASKFEAAELEFYKMERSLAPGLLDGWADPMRSAKAAERE